jgi:hypothetical protein
MEFPPETYDVFKADQFETAHAGLTGDAVMEVDSEVGIDTCK